VKIDGITIKGTRSSAPWEVGMRTENGGALSNVTLSNITITGNLTPFATNASSTAYSLLRWTKNGVALADHS
jgi:hypothetical protein